MHKIIIQVGGEAGTGKSILAHLITEALQAKGLQVTLQDDNGTGDVDELPGVIAQRTQEAFPGLAEKVEVEIKTVQFRGSLPVGTKHEFKVFRVSSNTNDFGLRGVWIFGKDGRVWEFGINDLNLRTHKLNERGNVVNLEVGPGGTPLWSTIGAEIPHEKPKAPQNIIDIIWTKTPSEW